MKKIIFSIILIVIIIVAIVVVGISNKNKAIAQITEFNSQFEKFKRRNYVWCRCTYYN